jgi:hypothetical protein
MRMGCEMTSLGLEVIKQEICLWVLMGIRRNIVAANFEFPWSAGLGLNALEVETGVFV